MPKTKAAAKVSEVDTNGKKLWDVNDLAAVSDLARKYGVSNATVSNWPNRYESYPPAVCAVGGRKLFSYKQVRRWRKASGWQD